MPDLLSEHNLILISTVLGGLVAALVIYNTYMGSTAYSDNGQNTPSSKQSSANSTPVNGDNFGNLSIDQMGNPQPQLPADPSNPNVIPGLSVYPIIVQNNYKTTNLVTITGSGFSPNGNVNIVWSMDNSYIYTSVKADNGGGIYYQTVLADWVSWISNFAKAKQLNLMAISYSAQAIDMGSGKVSNQGSSSIYS